MIYLCVQITKIQIMKIELVVSFYMFKLTYFGANAWKIRQDWLFDCYYKDSLYFGLFWIFVVEDAGVMTWLWRLVFCFWFMVLNAKHGSNNDIHSFVQSTGVLSVYGRAGFFLGSMNEQFHMFNKAFNWTKMWILVIETLLLWLFKMFHETRFSTQYVPIESLTQNYAD